MKKLKNAALSLMAMFSTSAFAALPTKPSSSTTSTNNGYVGVVQGYVVDGLILIGLMIGAYAFIRVAMNAIQAYGDISDGNGTYRDLGGHLIVGVVIASGVIWLLTEAMRIFGA